MDRIIALTHDQIEELGKIPLQRDARPVRFMALGKSVQLETGALIGGNVIYHMVYWDWTKERVDRALAMLRANNPGEAMRVDYSN